MCIRDSLLTGPSSASPAGVLSYLPCWRGFAGGAPRRVCSLLGRRQSTSPRRRVPNGALWVLWGLRDPSRRRKAGSHESRWFTAPEWDNDWAFSWSSVYGTRLWFATTSRENHGAWSPVGTRAYSPASLARTRRRFRAAGRSWESTVADAGRHERMGLAVSRRMVRQLPVALRTAPPLLAGPRRVIRTGVSRGSGSCSPGHGSIAVPRPASSVPVARTDCWRCR